MKKLIARIKASFSSPKKDSNLKEELKKIKTEIFNLEEGLLLIQGMSDKIEAFVEFFKVVSPIYKRGNLNQGCLILLKNRKYKQLDQIIKPLEEINSCLFSCRGKEIEEDSWYREMVSCWYNRSTEIGGINKDTIYLGGYDNLPMSPISSLLGNKNFDFGEGKTTLSIITEQANEILELYLGNMLQNILLIKSKIKNF